METICQKYNLLNNEDGLIRVPFLVKGRLVLPPKLSLAQVMEAFAGVEPGAGEGGFQPDYAAQCQFDCLRGRRAGG